MSGSLIVTTIAILAAAGLVLVRALRGPTVYDRILAVNMLGTKTVLFLAILGSFEGRAGFLDVAILYALINYIATIAILKYVEFQAQS